jgi:uncharacterized protein (TIGR02246 family)
MSAFDPLQTLASFAPILVRKLLRGTTMAKVFWILVLACAFSGPAVSATQPDEQKIRALEQEQAESWNAHDIHAYAALFTADATVVNVLGWQWDSRAELEQKLGQAFRSVFARSRMAIGNVSVHFLKPDVAIAHVRWSMSGALSPTGAGTDVPQQGIQTQVLVRRAGSWRITDFQNTNSMPEKAFPPVS